MSRFGFTALSLVVVALVAAAAVALVSHDGGNEQTVGEPIARAARTVPPSQSNATAQQSKPEAAATDSSSDFEFDTNRLYDPVYETDPALVEFAAAHGISPACLIARVKAHIDNVPANTACANETPRYDFSAHRLDIRTQKYVCEDIEGVPSCKTVRVREHPYDEYSDAELRYLADSSAEASLLLARRLGWDEEAEYYFEQAVALSGKSGPLERFLVMENAVGISRLNGKLVVPEAMTTYEVSLVMDWLGWPDDRRLRYVEAALLEEGYDLGPARQRAEERYNRITQRRLELLGRNWDDG